jgi:hypothetical protein
MIFFDGEDYYGAGQFTVNHAKLHFANTSQHQHHDNDIGLGSILIEKYDAAVL